MAKEQAGGARIDLSLKRKEDLTVSDLKGLPWFKDHNDEALAAIIEAAKCFTRAILYLHTRTGMLQYNKKAIDLIITPKKKAA
ncbi:hypothetical protein [Taibaiella helva]|uniref:hypothetical protein n=1 Tax=Taibaiella helva TaxID=2301235 RepID=UPI000E57F099|nr:hypothetical protein [Taibaiella helva]